MLFIMLDHHILLFLCPGLFWLARVQQVRDDLEASVGACTVIMLQACSLSRSDASLCCPFSALFFLQFVSELHVFLIIFCLWTMRSFLDGVIQLGLCNVAGGWVGQQFFFNKLLIFFCFSKKKQRSFPSVSVFVSLFNCAAFVINRRQSKSMWKPILKGIVTLISLTCGHWKY